MLAAGDDWGGGTAATRERVLIEFVSANPTGPLTAASGRHAAYGDALARLLEFAGHEVAREYYFNDAGGQVLKLGASIRARARGETVPEDGYPGDYVAELAAEIEDAAERDAEDLAFAGGQLMIERIQATLERFRVHFDTWFSERSLHDGGESSARSSSGEGRPRLPVRGRAVAADHRLRRRPGPGDGDARPARRPTSPPTSPTSRTSSSAASSA